jgi:transcription termination/antitermination protein NusG
MKRWYVIQVYAGYEEAIKKEIEKRIEERGLADIFGQILIPSAKMKHFFEAGSSLQDQQLFPGYMVLEMEPKPEAFRLVSSTPRVIRFLGGKEPVALTQKEIDRIIAQMTGAVVIAAEKHEFEMGKEVEITDGPFAGFVGIIDSIDEDNERLTVMVSIFGRMTPVELRFDQVKQ